MKEYIEREALLEKLDERDLVLCVTEWDIKDAPAADVVEVVRCGECKYFCEPFCVRRDDETHRERINMLTVDFCSYGKRRVLHDLP